MTAVYHNKTFDPAKALHFLGHDLELLRKLTAAYAATADHNFSELIKAIAEQDHLRCRTIMHRVMPTLRLVGAEELILSAERLHAALDNNSITPDVFSPSGFLSQLCRLNSEMISSTRRFDLH